jgi:hypothetical protein
MLLVLVTCSTGKIKMVIHYVPPGSSRLVCSDRRVPEHLASDEGYTEEPTNVKVSCAKCRIWMLARSVPFKK